MSGTRRWLALGGIAGPIAFVAAWSVLGAVRAGYSPVHDPISELAAVGAPGRVWMTAGFIAFAIGVGAYVPALCAALPGGAGAAVAASAVGALCVAFFPLGADLGDGAHAASAALAYLSLAAAPLLGARTFSLRGRRRCANLSILAGITVGASLLASVLLPQGVGLAQRIGLTTADAWLVVTAAMMFRGDRCLP